VKKPLKYVDDSSVKVVGVLELLLVVEGGSLPERGLLFGVLVNWRLVVVEVGNVGADQLQERVLLLAEPLLERQESK
jgi:hypothetical protein